MSAIKVFETVGNAYSYSFQNIEYFFRSMVYILPLIVATNYLTSQLEGDSPSISAALVMLVIFIPTFLANAAFAYTWHNNALSGNTGVHNPFKFTSDFVLFIKKALWIAFIGFALMFGVVVLGFGVTGALAATMPPAGFVAGLITLGAIVYLMYWLMGYMFALPAAALGKNLKIKDARIDSKPYRLKYVLSIFVAAVPIMIITIVSGIIFSLLGLIGPGSNMIIAVVAYIPLSIIQLFGTTVGVVILCSCYKIIFGVSNEMIANAENLRR